MRNWIIAALIAVIAIGGVISAVAVQRASTARVEVTVWQRIEDGSLYLSTRPQGGSWTTHPTALDMSQISPSGNFRQGSAITVEIPVAVPDDAAPEPGATGNDLTVSGVGSDTQHLQMGKGLWTCEFTIAGTEDDNVIVWLHGDDDRDLVVNEIANSGTWKRAIRVGDRYADITSVKLIAVDVEQGAEWTFGCTRA